jgi:hypothetical protein
MVRAIKILILCLLTVSGFAQVVQERNARGADRIIILKDGFRVPIRDTATAPALLNYSGDSSRGGVVYDSTLQKLCFWTGLRWVCLDDEGGGAGVDTIYRKAGQDSIFYTINGGAERAIKDSVGGGGAFPSDSLAVRRAGIGLINYVGWDANTSGGTNTVHDNQNILIGRLAGQAMTSGNRNVAIGPRALSSTQGGTENIAIGDRALFSNTSGTRNVAAGIQTLQNNTTGSNNFALGWTALFNNTTGGSNVAIGSEALKSNTTNSQSVAIGARALRLSTAANVTAIGANAGENTTATGGVFIGQAAGINVTTGAHNVMVGLQAGGNITTGNNNTIVGGDFTGQGNLTKSNSTNIGRRAGYFSNENFSTFVGAEAGANGNFTYSTGQYNIGLGYQAMRTTPSARTGSSNIAIGDRIDIPSITSSNQVVIGSNSVNWLTRFTGGGWLFNNTGSAVTTQTPSTALEINGTTGAVLLPRLTTAQRDALTPTDGMQIYNTTTNKFQGRAGGAWVDLH